jgi:hypothetical protein
MLQNAVDWWCRLVGISDPTAIQIAVGIVGAASLLLVVWLAAILLFAAIAALDAADRRSKIG